jgi:hypothetical protein
LESERGIQSLTLTCLQSSPHPPSIGTSNYYLNLAS